MIIAATSFHWIDPSIAYVKSAAVLKSNGSLAVFSNEHIRRNERFFLRVQDIYRATLGPETNTKRNIEKPAGMELFGKPIVRRYQWAIEYTAKEYIDLLGTYSDNISLPEAKRRSLFSGIADLINGEYGGKVLKHDETVLQLRKKK